MDAGTILITPQRLIPPVPILKSSTYYPVGSFRIPLIRSVFGCLPGEFTNRIIGRGSLRNFAGEDALYTLTGQGAFIDFVCVGYV